MGIDLGGLVAKISEQLGGHAQRIDALERADEERRQALSDLKAQVAAMADKADMRYDRFDAKLDHMADKLVDSLPPGVTNVLVGLLAVFGALFVGAVGWAVYLLIARHGG